MSSLHFCLWRAVWFAVFGDILFTSMRHPYRDKYGLLKAESSDWQGAHPGRVPTRRCGDVSLPFGAQGSGLAGRGQGVEFHLAGLEEDGPGSSQRCLTDQKRKKNN